MSFLSLRSKIILLIGCTLLVSLSAYLYVGTGLMVADKTSYIYEFTHARLRTVSGIVEYRLQSVSTGFGSLARFMSASDASPDRARAFFEAHRDLPQSLIAARPSSLAGFELVAELGPRSDETLAAWKQLKLSPAAIPNQEYVTGKPTEDGKLPLAVVVRDAKGIPTVVFGLVDLESLPFGEAAKELAVHVVDDSGDSIFASKEMSALTADQKLASVEAQLAASPFDTGARELSAGVERYLVAYQRIRLTRLITVVFIPRSKAFEASRLLVIRSAVLGAGILLLSFGFALMMARGITSRLRQLWQATQKATEGDFTVRVPESGGNDEVRGLSVSYNRMAERISELMNETAEKARMEKELETAHEVQRRFIPEKGIGGEQARLFGRSLPASECGGDWWQYAQVGNLLVVAIGDVTGHGVPSALVTGAAHAGFCIAVERLKLAPSDPSPEAIQYMINLVVGHIHVAVAATGGNDSVMSAFICVVDLVSGMMYYANAAHRPAYIYRKGEVPLARVADHFIALVESSSLIPPLGDGKRTACTPTAVQLAPGDTVYLYTDGLTECENEEKKRFNRAVLFQSLASASDSGGDAPERICQSVVTDYLEFLGDKRSLQEDDTTVVVLKLPRSARFVQPGTADVSKTGLRRAS